MSILQEQIRYYRARATEYDEWFYRQGRYDRGADDNQRWFDEMAQVREALHQSGLSGHILELAAGTGIWTEELIQLADSITIVDAAPEMIAINQARLQSERIRYIQADLFTWQPEQQYDAVFFAYWLSHVPPEKLHDFLLMVNKALKPDGRIFMIDSRRVDSSTAHDHEIPRTGTTLARKLNDGREFNIIKVFYTPDMLQSAFKDAGLTVTAQITDTYVIYATGKK